ncbi:uncharacterized protein LOC101521192 [Ochotona princeps]|uniref:uncharacterized protein LOC101521192 n=1 Tax=Ochotona princeps TaxID=9978 RepID=UPI0027152E94|nr:uncharacterized protein LOC101521192 [Ochotona princeps]
MADGVPLICDYGSALSKVGFAGKEAPQVIFPTILGKLRHDNLLVGMEEEEWFIGAEAQRNCEKIILQYPISRSSTTNWDTLEMIWHHSFYQLLHVAPEQHPVLMTEPPLNSRANKEKMCQILFETFNVPALYLANQAVLSLYSSGYTSGTTIESGEGMTHFVPIIEGCALHQSALQVDVAGQDLTTFLLRLLSDKGHLLVSTADRDRIRDLKEKCCYVALDFDKEKGKSAGAPCQETYRLPDGQEIRLGPERFLCPEALFQTGLIGRNSVGMPMMAVQSVSACRPAHWKALFGHILLSGGTGCLAGLRFRLQREITALVSPALTVKVCSCPYSAYGAWVGGSILCSLSTFEDMWVTSSEYREVGCSVASRRSY